MFFHSWSGLGRIIVVGVLAYGGLVLMLRLSGKRTLAKMNAFDFVVTVALGSTFATVLLSKDVPLAEGILALAVLTLLQFVITWLSVRSPAISRLVKSEPRLLFHRGQFLRSAMRGERVREDELLAGMRAQGFPVLKEVEAVVLETDGTFSVLSRADTRGASTLAHVGGAPSETD